MKSITIFSRTITVFLLTLSQSTEAYIGPGAGISAIGTVIALIGAILLIIVGFVWYPIKRLLAKKKKATDQDSSEP